MFMHQHNEGTMQNRMANIMKVQCRIEWPMQGQHNEGTMQNRMAILFCIVPSLCWCINMLSLLLTLKPLASLFSPWCQLALLHMPHLCVIVKTGNSNNRTERQESCHVANNGHLRTIMEQYAAPSERTGGGCMLIMPTWEHVPPGFLWKFAVLKLDFGTYPNTTYWKMQ